MANCIFCNIISKIEKAYIVYEDEYVCCFLDKYPICKGHVLVVPKKHYEEFSDVDQESLSKVLHAAQQVTIALEKLLHTDGITVMQNNGIFKDVDHYHMHIVPWYKNDGFSWIEPNNEVTENDFVLLNDQLKSVLN